jgi:hypothetical protein
VQTYPALSVMARHGGPFAAVSAMGVLLLCLWIGFRGAGPGFWVVAGLAAGAATMFLLLVMRDIVRLIADTLVPAP